MKNNEFFPMISASNQRESDMRYFEELNSYWDNSIGTNLDKLRSD